MSLDQPVLEATRQLAAHRLTQLHREHEERLRDIAAEHHRKGVHSRSATHGRAIVRQIADTYQQRADVIWNAILESLPLQRSGSVTVADLTTLFGELFEPERSRVLEGSRPRLAEMADGGSFIDDTIKDARITTSEIEVRIRLHLGSSDSGQAHVAPSLREKHPRTFRTAFDEYTRIEQIGEGGTGFVFSARNTQGEVVAIKYLDPARTNQTRRKRFQNEIRFGQRAQHPNLLPILDVGEVSLGERQTPFYVMPRYPMTLRKAMKAGTSPDQAFAIFLAILNGVEAAHLQSIWHRDLKPENILLSEDLSEVRVADFGIAHFAEEELYTAAETREADRLFAIRYAAPEQMNRNAPKDHRADIFALGYILHELFTNEVPHGTRYERISIRHPRYHYLDDVVELMIRSRPADRADSIATVRTEIEGRAEIALAQQRLDRVSRQVVTDDCPDDPLLTDPVRITGRDWADGVLRIDLSRRVSPQWKELFFGIGYQGILIGADPRGAGWAPSDDRFFLHVQADETRIQRTIDACKSHIERVNAEYGQRMRAEHQRQHRKAIEERRREIDAEQDRIRVLQATRI